MIVGILAVAGAATCLGIMPSIQKQLLVDGLPMNSLMFFTNLTISAVCMALAKAKGRSLKARPAQLIQALVMGTSGMLLTALLLNNSYLYLPVGTAIMLNFLYPSIVCIIMGTVFKEGFTKLQIAAIVVSITGMAFLTGAGGEMPLIGIVLAVVSAFTYGGYLVANEKGPANELPIETKLFYVSLPGSLLFGILAPVTGTLAAPAGGIGGWLFLICGSGLFTVGGYFMMMYGISRLGASTAAFISMLEPVVSVIFGTIWFKDPVTLGIAAGGGLVITSILLITIDGYQKSR
ncbi:DMT family transporter [Lacrimispora sp. 210928-DFI.3.58]|uniref:DMT family transporter n=1 Tax=Lacrimispora sp. 210928-DFI.3.58 TaxID=2883214 RepID=UPI001D06788E|nr:DMT family transporter [Lacrimispora sp. 210928-DFI.3.58]MCB7318525.1 DMT family transporter [Lacrimispora sp. 210928-DFI.3.58]